MDRQTFSMLQPTDDRIVSSREYTCRTFIDFCSGYCTCISQFCPFSRGQNKKWKTDFGRKNIMHEKTAGLVFLPPHGLKINDNNKFNLPDEDADLCAAAHISFNDVTDC